MKKACLAFAILFLVSALLAVCFGAAVGARELKEIAAGNSSVNRWIDSLRDWYAQRRWGGDESLLDTTTLEFAVSPQEKLHIAFETAQVQVLPSENGAAYIQFRYYGTGDALSSGQLPYLEREGGVLYVGTRLPENAAASRVEADIYLPQEQLAALEAHIDVGELVVEGLRCKAVEANVQVGDISFRSCLVDRAELTADTGNLAWEGGNLAAGSLSMHAGVGDIRLEWPKSMGFQLRYKIGTGEFQNAFGQADSSVPEGPARSSSGTFSYGEEGCTMEMTTSAGNIILSSIIS